MSADYSQLTRDFQALLDRAKEGEIEALEALVGAAFQLHQEAGMDAYRKFEPQIAALTGGKTPPCERLCVVCRHFRISGHTEDYSDLTPGERAELRCELMLWPQPTWERDNGDGYMMNITTSSFRWLIETAETCASFDPNDGTERP